MYFLLNILFSCTMVNNFEVRYFQESEEKKHM